MERGSGDKLERYGKPHLRRGKLKLLFIKDFYFMEKVEKERQGFKNPLMKLVRPLQTDGDDAEDFPKLQESFPKL